MLTVNLHETKQKLRVALEKETPESLKEWYKTLDGAKRLSPVQFTVDWTDMATVHQYKGLGFHCISILSKREPDFDLSGFLSTLELEFDDVRLTQENKALQSGIQKEWRLFSQEDAEKVWRYVEQLPYGASILVHCEAGVSRSSAVAAALATIYCNGDDTSIFQSPKALPNLYVYGMMMMHCPRKGVVAKGIIH